MKSKKIYLVRHGQTDYNLKGIVQGSGIDAPINEKGRSQAEQFYQAYKNVAFDAVYTSELLRSIQSVAKFIDNGIPHTILPGLNEINWGSREGIVITPEEDAYYHKVISQWKSGNTFLRIHGGESPEDVQKRQNPAIKEIIDNTETETVLICMHGRAMRILLCLLLEYPLHRMDEFEHSNLCLYRLTYKDRQFELVESNVTSHLD